MSKKAKATKRTKGTKTNKANQLEDIKSDFITIASHQLRTPISAIRWSLDTLLSGRVGNLTDKQKEVTTEAYQNNKFMIKVVNDLLRVSRIEEKGVDLVPTLVDLKPIFSAVIDQYQDLASAFNCKIILKAQPSCPKAYVDAIQIKSVIEALVDNAVRYSQLKGSVKITLKKSKDSLLFQVSDQGIGIPNAETSKVFSKFYRGSNALKAQTEGLGLNLYLVKKIVDASGGKIDFISNNSFGTTFSVYLPTKVQIVTSVKIDKVAEVEAAETLKKEREFVSITVHELKAPLGITKWSLEMLQSQKQGQLTKDQLELVEQIYHGNERLLILVRDLLNLSKLQEGKFEVNVKPVDLASIVSEVIKGFQVEAKKKSIKLHWQGSTGRPQVLADRARVAQVVTNLASNAIKYTPNKGSVIVKIEKMSGAQLQALSQKSKTIHIEYASNRPGYLVVAVKDTGIGISPEDQTKLFTRFFRSKKVLKSATEGTGLGLYITKSIVNLHQGDIWFTSQLGQGSIFYFSLPISKK